MLEALPIGHGPLPEDQRARPSSRSFRLTKGPLTKAKGPLKYDIIFEGSFGLWEDHI